MVGEQTMSYIKVIIDKWDPIDLLSFAPKDEYQLEIEQVEVLAGLTEDVFVLSEGIYEIFVSSFGEDTFKKSRSDCMKIAELIMSLKPKIRYVDQLDALQIIEDCRDRKIRVLGIDGFLITSTTTQPLMEHSVDYSNIKEAWDEAISFIHSKADLGLKFEVISEVGLDLDSIYSTINESKDKYFQESDGWLLYTLSGKPKDLTSIIAEGDLINHAIFNYNELNDGLLRLIQNGFIERVGSKYRMTREGKVFIRKARFLLGYLMSSTSNMIYLCGRIAKTKMSVDVDYSNIEISRSDYDDAVTTHNQSYINWQNSKK